MSSLASTVGIGAVVFAVTNIDDVIVVAAFFADQRLPRRAVVVGQFLGIGVLVLASALAALLTLAVPQGWIALLGLVPLAMGLRSLVALRRGRLEDEESTGRVAAARLDERPPYGPMLAIAAVTVANGGDNLGVYIPLFASTPDAIPAYAAVFGLMTALLCLVGHLAVNNRLLGASTRRYGHVALPFVLIAVGGYILSGAAALFQ
jgi:cadmium resistance protein CadD (predicted permease)